MNKLKKILLDSPYLLLVLGFLIVILLGSILLSMPLASATGERTNYLNALFTATSATCITGLAVLDTGVHFNTLGHIIILILMQIGAIGVMGFIALSINLLKGKFSIKHKITIKEAYNLSNIGDSWLVIKYIFAITFIIELLGAIILSIAYIPLHGFKKGLFYSIFHSVSAFSNGGFDLNSNFSSLKDYSNNLLIIITTLILVSLGSLGFICIMDIVKKKSFKKLSLNSKLVLIFTFYLFISSTLLFFVIEYNNPETFRNLTLVEKIVHSMFLSISPRSSGLSFVDISNMNTSSILIFILLMFIGGSPSSTGGGLKTTTIIIAILSIIALFKGKEDIEIFERRIPKSLILKSFALISVVFIITILSVIILSITEQADFLNILFEVSSALNTVGASLGLTQNLTSFGKLVIISLMYIGRIGPLTFILALSLKQKSDSNVRYIEEHILIG